MKTATITRLKYSFEETSPSFKCKKDELLFEFLGRKVSRKIDSVARFLWSGAVRSINTRVATGETSVIVTAVEMRVGLQLLKKGKAGFDGDDSYNWCYMASFDDDFSIGKRNYLSVPSEVCSLDVSLRDAEEAIEKDFMRRVKRYDLSVFDNGRASCYERDQRAALSAIDALNRDGYGASQKHVALFLDKKINQLVVTKR